MGEASFGKYRLIAELGHGGMADVFLAVIAGPAGSGFSKLTVVKRLRQNLADEPEFVEMLVDEARIAARLNHPNVVQTNEVGSVDNQYFIAMEYLDGQPLHRIQHRAMQKAQKAAAEPAPPSLAPSLSQDGSSLAPSSLSGMILAGDPFPKACQYLVLVETLAGLHHAHSLSDYDGTPLDIVHRDVTPHNVFVTYEGQTKVVDFGIAKAAGRASETRQGVVKGKVRYMAPEQATGHSVDRRADVFSVGIMLWEAATGRRLWKDMDDLNIVQALVGGTLPSSPRSIDPNVPEGIDAICRKALAYNVEDRYATADDMRLDLETYLAESGQLVSARRKLGAVVSELFKDKRAEIKTVIEKQLAQMKARSVTDLKPTHIPLDSSSTSSAVVPASSAGGVTVPTVAPARSTESVTTMTDAATELYTSSKKKEVRSSRMPFVLGAAALVVVTGLFATYRVRLHSADARPATTAAAETTPTADIRLRISTNPPGALVSVDGAPLTKPSDAKMPRDGHDHLVRAEAPGFEPYVETVRFENDLEMSIVMNATAVRTPPAQSSHPRTPPPPPTNARWAPPPPPAPTPKQTITAATAPPPSAAPTTSSTTPKIVVIGIKDDPWADAGKK